MAIGMQVGVEYRVPLGTASFTVGRQWTTTSLRIRGRPRRLLCWARRVQAGRQPALGLGQSESGSVPSATMSATGRAQSVVMDSSGRCCCRSSIFFFSLLVRAWCVLLTNRVWVGGPHDLTVTYNLQFNYKLIFFICKLITSRKWSNGCWRYV